MREAAATRIVRTENKSAARAPIVEIQFEGQLHSGIIGRAATKTAVRFLRIELENLPHFCVTPTPCARARRAANHAGACASRPAEAPLVLPHPARSAFHLGWRTPSAAYSEAETAHRNSGPEQTAPRAHARGSSVRWHRNRGQAPAREPFRLPADSTAPLRAYSCAALRPARSDARRRSSACVQDASGNGRASEIPRALPAPIGRYAGRSSASPGAAARSPRPARPARP